MGLCTCSTGRNRRGQLRPHARLEQGPAWKLGLSIASRLLCSSASSSGRTRLFHPCSPPHHSFTLCASSTLVVTSCGSKPLHSPAGFISSPLCCLPLALANLGPSWDPVYPPSPVGGSTFSPVLVTLVCHLLTTSLFFHRLDSSYSFSILASTTLASPHHLDPSPASAHRPCLLPSALTSPPWPPHTVSTRSLLL